VRKTHLILAAAAASGLALQAANAEHKSQWYISLGGGANFADLNQDSSLDFDSGWAALATLGYKFDNRIRLEAEGGFRSDDGSARDIFVAAPPMGIESTALSLMGNMIVEVPLSERVDFNIGAGAGVAQVGIDVSAPVTPDGTDKDTLFAWQLIAQADFEISRRTELFVDYHYLQTANDLSLKPYSTPAYGSRSMQYEAHSLSLGLRYYFGQPEEATPPPPPPLPPPPPPPAAKQFIVFFGFNKSNLTAEGQAVVAEAAAVAKAQGSARILVVGHTDSVGSGAYNDELSSRRAGAVKDELTRLGISADAITASGKGETELMVQTGDGVKEPQNRRATIDLN
jgi:OOP family OmpA-OmpF porin